MENKDIANCKYCKKKHTCIKRNTTIFFLFIVTGRDKEAPIAQENMSIANGECKNYEYDNKYDDLLTVRTEEKEE